MKEEQKNVIVEEELDCIDIDDIGNLEDSPRLVFINEEFRNLIVVNDGGELTEKGRRFTVAHSVTKVEGESISSVTCRIFIINS